MCKTSIIRKLSQRNKSLPFKSNQIIISIMAGITINQINDRTNHEKIIRIMPNTPAQISKGISVWNSTNNLSEMEKNKIGKCIEFFW